MRFEPASKIVCRSDISIAVAQFKKINVPHARLPALLRSFGETPYALHVSVWRATRSPKGVGWRRGRDSNPRYGCPYAAFRVRCIQPLCHLSAESRPSERRGAVLAARRRWHKAKARGQFYGRASRGRRRGARWQSRPNPTKARTHSRGASSRSRCPSRG
jgi:hypothetical protein